MNEKEIIDLCKPIIQFLKDNCHPHMAIVITTEHIQLEEIQLSIPVNMANQNDQPLLN